MTSETAQVSSLPLPPMQYINFYTDDNVRRNRAPLPPRPIHDTYSMFGHVFNADDAIIRSLESQVRPRKILCTLFLLYHPPSLRIMMSKSNHRISPVLLRPWNYIRIKCKHHSILPGIQTFVSYAFWETKRAKEAESFITSKLLRFTGPSSSLPGLT